MDYVTAPYRVATSPAAKRTYLGTFLFFATSLALLCIAALAYPVFYYNYVPQKVISIPVHLQYNAGINPYGITSVSPNLMREQAYDVSVELTLPRSPANLERGNFMVAMFAMKSQPDNPAFAFSTPSDPYEHVTERNVVFSSRRPALIPYADPLVSTASRVMFLLYHVFYPVSEKNTLTIPMGELVEFNDILPLSFLLDVQAGQALQVYSTTITLVARLSGFRWLMYNHRIISFVACTTVFWISEMMSMGLAWLLLSYILSNRQGKAVIKHAGAGKERMPAPAKREDNMAIDPYYDGARDSATAGTSGQNRNSRVKREGDVKVKEESTDHESPVDLPRHVGDTADDEEDGEDVWKESGAGTSFHDGKGGSLRRRSSRGGKS